MLKIYYGMIKPELPGVRNSVYYVNIGLDIHIVSKEGMNKVFKSYGTPDIDYTLIPLTEEKAKRMLGTIISMVD